MPGMIYALLACCSASLVRLVTLAAKMLKIGVLGKSASHDADTGQQSKARTLNTSTGSTRRR